MCPLPPSSLSVARSRAQTLESGSARRRRRRFKCHDSWRVAWQRDRVRRASRRRGPAPCSPPYACSSTWQLRPLYHVRSPLTSPPKGNSSARTASTASAGPSSRQPGPVGCTVERACRASCASRPLPGMYHLLSNRMPQVAQAAPHLRIRKIYFVESG